MPKGYKWVHCWLDAERHVNVCSLYQPDGSLWYTDDFLPYKASGPIPPERMKISQNFGVYTIQLDDGTRMIRKSVYEQTVKLWETPSNHSK
jgi:hypothetical protein